MTGFAGKRIRKSRLSLMTPGKTVFGFFSVFCLCLILRNSDTAIAYMNSGLTLCAKTVIPSLFPFMVLSELIVSGGIASTFLSKICRPLARAFRISSDGCCALLLGVICGFPVGARCTVLALDRGRITREEAERILTFSNTPSSAFLISAVGVSLWGNRSFGIALYGVILASAALVGFVGAKLPIAKRRTEQNPLPKPVPQPIEPPQSGYRLFTDAIRASVQNILLVCAYVVFFSALIGTLNLCLLDQNLPPPLHALIFCLFELSGGVSRASALTDPRMAALLCAFAAGWSGLSVHCQVLTVCDGRGLSFRPYFLSKLAQGVLAVFLLACLLWLFPSLLTVGSGVFGG